MYGAAALKPAVIQSFETLIRADACKHECLQQKLTVKEWPPLLLCCPADPCAIKVQSYRSLDEPM